MRTSRCCAPPRNARSSLRTPTRGPGRARPPRPSATGAASEKSFASREAERAEAEDLARELRKLALREGEWALLAAEHARLAHGSSLLAGAQSSLEALSEAEGAALPRLAAVASRLRALSEHDARLGAIVELLESAEAQAGEAARELRPYASRIELDPEKLREAEARIEALHAAARKHRVRPQELAERLAELERRLAELELAVNPEALMREVASSRRKFMDRAAQLSAKRAAAAQAFSKAVTAAMQRLAMAGGRFSVSLRKLEEPAASGMEEVEFEVASHPSLPLRS